jgi:hypothetical protein
MTCHGPSLLLEVFLFGAVHEHFVSKIALLLSHPFVMSSFCFFDLDILLDLLLHSLFCASNLDLFP